MTNERPGSGHVIWSCDERPQKKLHPMAQTDKQTHTHRRTSRLYDQWGRFSKNVNALYKSFLAIDVKHNIWIHKKQSYHAYLKDNIADSWVLMLTLHILWFFKPFWHNYIGNNVCWVRKDCLWEIILKQRMLKCVSNNTTHLFLNVVTFREYTCSKKKKLNMLKKIIFFSFLIQIF